MRSLNRLGIVLTLIYLQGCLPPTDDNPSNSSSTSSSSSDSSSSSSSSSDSSSSSSSSLSSSGSSSSSSSSSGTSVSETQLNEFSDWNRNIISGYIAGNYRHLGHLALQEQIIAPEHLTDYANLLAAIDSEQYQQMVSVLPGAGKVAEAVFNRFFMEFQTVGSEVIGTQFTLTHQVDEILQLSPHECPLPPDCTIHAKADIRITLDFPEDYLEQRPDTAGLHLPNGTLLIQDLQLRNTTTSLRFTEPAEVQFSMLSMPSIGSDSTPPPYQTSIDITGLVTPQRLQLELQNLLLPEYFLHMAITIPKPVTTLQFSDDSGESTLAINTTDSPLLVQVDWEMGDDLLHTEFGLDINGTTQQELTQLLREVSSLWIDNPNWDPLATHVNGYVNATVILNQEPILQSRYQLAANSTEKNTYTVTAEDINLEHTHERDLSGTIQSAQGQDHLLGLNLNASFATGSVTGTIANDSGETLADIISNNFGGWYLQFYE